MMIRQRVGVLLVAALISAALAGRSAAADAPKVLNVIAVKVKGDQSVYLEKVKKLNAVMKRLESGGTIRVWRATMAGEDVGRIYVGIEYPNLETLAKANAKAQADEEWTRLVKEMDTSGIREVIANSLLVEVTPQ